MDDFLKELLTLGRSHFLRKQYPRAEKYLAQVVEQNQSFADVYNMLGVIYHDQGQFARARHAFEAALKINPAYTEAALNLSIIYNDMGLYQEARDVYQNALSRGQSAPGELDRFIKGKIANMYADIAEVFVSSGHFDEGLAEYERALSYGPGFVDLRVKMGAALRDKGDKEGALREFQRVVDEAPQYLPARIQLGVVLFSLGRTEEAIEQWEEVLRRNPENQNATMYLSLVRKSPKATG